MQRNLAMTGVLGLLLVGMLYYMIAHAVPTLRAALGARDYLESKGWRYVELLPIKRLDNCQYFMAYEPPEEPPNPEDFGRLPNDKTFGKMCYTWNGKIRLRRLN